MSAAPPDATMPSREVAFRGGGFVLAPRRGVAALAFVVLIAVWEIAVRFGWISPIFLPSPSSVVSGISSAQVLNSRCQLGMSGLGQHKRTRRTCPARSSRRMAVIVCIVLPRPISSASRADFRRIRNCSTTSP